MQSYFETYDRLRRTYVEGAEERLGSIADHLHRLEANLEDRAPIGELNHLFHGLVGSGATYGFPHISALCGQAEAECQMLLEEERSPTAEDIGCWKDLVERCRDEFRRTPLDEPPAFRRPKASRPEKTSSVLLVDADEDHRGILAAILKEEGIEVRHAGLREEALAMLEKGGVPNALVTDVKLPDGTGYELAEHVRGMPWARKTSVFLVADSAAFWDKVEAIRCGALGCFEKTDGREELVRRLFEKLKDDATVKKWKILYVEDDPDQAAFIESLLDQAGCEVRICPHPKGFEKDLGAFQPDLVLMDVVLPGASGFDLVKFMRQSGRWAKVPVVFLTTQKQLDHRIHATRVGGDDFLEKPVVPALLLTAISSRIERARFLETLMERDGLTRLLNHSAFMERCQQVVVDVRKKRDRKACLVLMDMDNFGAVNAGYGFGAGDEVLLAFASLLRRRLGRNECVGRIGGEEFAAIVEDLTPDQVVDLIGSVQTEFGGTYHQGPDGSRFRITVSAAAAAFDPRRMDFEGWMHGARRGLELSKDRGGGSILLFSDR